MGNSGNNNKAPTVLIADDSSEIRQLLRSSLMMCGCDVLDAVEDGEQALQQLDNLKPDIVFLDIDMPNKGGIELLEIIKSKNIEVFPVIISGYSTIDNLKAAMGSGAQGFVVKPYTQGKIQEVITKYIQTLRDNN